MELRHWSGPYEIALTYELMPFAYFYNKQMEMAHKQRDCLHHGIDECLLSQMLCPQCTIAFSESLCDSTCTRGRSAVEILPSPWSPQTQYFLYWLFCLQRLHTRVSKNSKFWYQWWSHEQNTNFPMPKNTRTNNHLSGF